MKKKYKIYHEKTISIIGESIIEYEKLPYEKKVIIDYCLKNPSNHLAKKHNHKTPTQLCQT
jgi:hypothetical protein